MKKPSFLILFLGLVCSSTSAFASAVTTAPEPWTVEASCFSKNVADAGYSVVITRDDQGHLNLKLSEESIVGSKLIGSFCVVAQEDPRARSRVYTGKDLTLTIDLSGVDTGNRYSAKITGAVLSSDQFTDLSCDVLNSR